MHQISYPSQALASAFAQIPVEPVHHFVAVELVPLLVERRRAVAALRTAHVKFVEDIVGVVECVPLLLIILACLAILAAAAVLSAPVHILRRSVDFALAERCKLLCVLSRSVVIAQRLLGFGSFRVVHGCAPALRFAVGMARDLRLPKSVRILVSEI